MWTSHIRISHLNAVFAAQRGIEWLADWELPKVRGLAIARQIKMWGADEVSVALYHRSFLLNCGIHSTGLVHVRSRHIWGPDWTRQSEIQTPAEERPTALRSVVGLPVSIGGIDYKIHACLTAAGDVDPVYELRAVNNPRNRRYIPLPELENLMG